MATDRRRTLWAAAATLAVAAGLIAALIHLGAPSERRMRRLDEQRVTGLKVLNRDLKIFLEKEGVLPPKLTEFASKPWADAIPLDPETFESFGYEALGPRRFHLCADFARPSPKPAPDRKPDFWDHPQGRHCYEIEIEVKETKECD